jgi:hypothetical protein
MAATALRSSLLSPLAYPSTWDVIQVGNVTSPGVCFLSGFKRVHDFDKKSGKGTEGATLTFTRKPPVEGTVKFLLALDGTQYPGAPDQFSGWATFCQQLKYDPTKTTVTAVDVYHPSLAQINATAFVCTEIGAVEIEGEPGMGLYSATIKLCEYAPPPKVSAVSTPQTATANAPEATAGTPPDPIAEAQQAQIAALMQKAAKT